MVDVIVTIAQTGNTADQTPYAITSVYRIEFESEVAAQAWMQTGLNYAIAYERLVGIGEE